MNLVVDVGNSRCKAALFENEKIKIDFVFEKEHILSEIKQITSAYSISRVILSSVSNLSENMVFQLRNIISFIELSIDLHFPFQNNYATPKTLGVDRLALATAACTQFPKTNTLVIDAGTCITYDFVNKSGVYLGGAISPGLTMRCKALHHFTAKLPLQEPEILADFIGNTTHSSINSGVVNGILQEIDGVIRQYRTQFPNLTVVLTGGDTNFLGKQLKSSIFANQNFLLEGLNALLTYNESK